LRLFRASLTRKDRLDSGRRSVISGHKALFTKPGHEKPARGTRRTASENSRGSRHAPGERRAPYTLKGVVLRLKQSRCSRSSRPCCPLAGGASGLACAQSRLHRLFLSLAHSSAAPVSGPPRPLCISPHPQHPSHSSYASLEFRRTVCSSLSSQEVGEHGPLAEHLLAAGDDAHVRLDRSHARGDEDARADIDHAHPVHPHGA